MKDPRDCKLKKYDRSVADAIPPALVVDLPSRHYQV